jgi:hypothetical protein
LGFPHIVSCGITLPLDEVLEFMSLPKESMSHDSFYFKLLFSVDYFGWWAAEVGPVLFCFVIGGEKGGVKDVMDGSGRRELELISDS